MLQRPGKRGARGALELAEDWIDRVLSDLITLSEIPAPTFEEKGRGERLFRLMERSGCDEVERDEAGNIIGVRRGSGGEKAIFLAAHMDTVFPREIDHTVRIDARRVYGPGVGDDGLGLAAMLAVLEILNEAEVETLHDLVFAGTVGGEGNFHGMRTLMKGLAGRVDYAISLEGHSLGRVDYVSVGNVRLRITCEAKGGDSWRDYGTSNAIVAVNRVINGLLALDVNSSPRTTINLGLIGGGAAYGTISSRATLGIDIRSEDEDELRRLESEVYDVTAKVGEIERVSIQVDEVTRTPGAGISSSHRLVRKVMDIHRDLGIRSVLGSGSLGGSIPLSAGIPTVTLGLTRGENPHRPEESIEIQPIARGLKQILLLVLALDEKSER